MYGTEDGKNEELTGSASKYGNGTQSGFGDDTALDALLGEMETAGSERESQSNPQSTSEPNTPLCGVFSVAYWKKYFDVDDSEVKARLFKALVPFKAGETLLERIQKHPDAYGPVWVSTTLVFALAFASTFSSWAHSTADSTWTYDFEVVVFAATLVYGYLIFAPLCVWGLLKYLSIRFLPAKLFCIYGYSLSIYIPTALCCCLIQGRVWDFILLLLACGTAFWTIFKSLGRFLDESAADKAIQIKILLISINLLFSVILFVVFFEF